MSLENAQTRWTELLGNNNARFEKSALSPYERTTFITETEVKGLLKVSSKEQLQKVVDIANEEMIPLYPISTGKNYGYGSKVPTRSGSVVVDLSPMNKIIDFNEKHGTLTVGPGVTFEQVFNFLAKEKSNFTLAGTGGPPSSSLIGNAIERGIGKGLAGNRIDNICNLEVVLPDGKCIHTGLGRFENAKGKRITKLGPGPFLDGMFTQSNLGIITEMTFWLTTRPKAFTTFIYAVNDESKIPQIVEALRELRQKDILRSSSTLFNDHRILGFMGKFPWDLNDGTSCLSDEDTKRALKRHMPVASKWYGDGALFCHSRAQARAEMRLVKKALRGLVSNLMFFREPYVSMMEMAVNTMRKVSKSSLFNPLDFYYKKSLYLGHPIPVTQTLGSTYIRKRTEVPGAESIDPDKDGCGTYWMGPIVPFDGQEVEAATKIIKRVISSHGYEPAMTLQFVSPRQVDIIVSISFDRDIPGEDEKAKACHDHLLKELYSSGYYPYRLGNQSQDMLPTPDDDYLHFIKKVKGSLDPNNILSPGRYDFSVTV